MINAKYANRITSIKEPYLFFKNSIYGEIYKAISFNMNTTEWENETNSNRPEEDVEDIKSICHYLEELGYKTSIDVKENNGLLRDLSIKVRITW